jgi:hypothetical protein
VSPEEVHRQVARMFQESDQAEAQARELANRALVARILAGKALGLQGSEFIRCTEFWSLHEGTDRSTNVPFDVSKVAERLVLTPSQTFRSSLHVHEKYWRQKFNLQDLVLDPALDLAAFSLQSSRKGYPIWYLFPFQNWRDKYTWNPTTPSTRQPGDP